MKAAFWGWSFPQIISCAFIVYWFLFSFYCNQQSQTIAYSRIYRKNITWLLWFVFIFHSTRFRSTNYRDLIKGYFWKGAVSVLILFWKWISQNHFSCTAQVLILLILIRWRGSSLVATRVQNRQSQNKLSKPKIVNRTLFF